MTLLPIVARELRVGSRRWTTYWLRLLAAGTVLIGVLLWFGSKDLSLGAGGTVFAWVHRIVIVAIWVLVPLMTCDCLSQEKREGTLGLLFLTNLSAREIVFAKTVAHGLRALTLWLAVVPIVGIPVLLGGMGWREIVLSCCLAFTSICFTLSIGLVASVFSRRINGAVALAAVFALAAYSAFAISTMAAVTIAGVFTGPQQWLEVSVGEFIEVSFEFVWNSEGTMWNEIFSYPSATRAVLAGMLFLSLSALLFLILWGLFAASVLRRNWQDKPKTRRQAEVENFLFKPVFWTALFRRWMRRSLERNPIGWLEKRSWTGRITAWIWLAVMILFASAITSETSHSYVKDFNALMWMLLVSIAYVAAGSFRRERETGALELILITPLSERQIISGRLRALWTQFLPTFALWMAAVLYLCSELHAWNYGIKSYLLCFTAAYIVVPIIGLYFSLRSRFVLLSWFLTLAVCFVPPQLIWWLLRRTVFSNRTLAVLYGSLYSAFPAVLPPEILVILSVQLALAGFLLWRLHVNLTSRSFSLR
jgi:ABC-type transport system involved in cytochrome c biogenesis permease component